MILLNDIPFEKYNDLQYCLDYLNSTDVIPKNSPIKSKDYHIFHAYWDGPLLDLHLLSINSLIKTQNVKEIKIWTSNPDILMNSPSYEKLKDKITIRRFNADVINGIRETNEIKNILKTRYNEVNKSSNQSSKAYLSDIMRFIVLHLEGGIYFDLDILFLRNFSDIKYNRWMTQWGTDKCGNACVLKLEKNHDVIRMIMGYDNLRPCFPTTSFKFDNSLDIMVLPSPFFDPLWGNILPKDSIFKSFDDFFHINWKEDDIFPGIFAYHWHGRWDKKLNNASN